jgi:hypothetical protein
MLFFVSSIDDGCRPPTHISAPCRAPKCFSLIFVCFVFVVLCCTTALSSPNQAIKQNNNNNNSNNNNQNNNNDNNNNTNNNNSSRARANSPSRSRSKSKSRSHSPAHNRRSNNNMSRSPSPLNENNNDNIDDNDATSLQPSAPPPPSNPNADSINNNSDSNINNNTNNKNDVLTTHITACTHIPTHNLRTVCLNYEDSNIITSDLSRLSLITFISKVMSRTQYTSIVSFITDNLKHDTHTRSRAHSSRSRSRSLSHYRRRRRPSKGNDTSNTNNNDMQLSSSKSSASSNSRTARRSKSRSSSHHRRHRSHSRSHSPHRHSRRSSSKRGSGSRRSSRSRSPSSRRHRHSSSSSSSSSSSRRRRHHSHSRDRSASPVLGPLSVPDPFALTLKPVPDDLIKQLAEGKTFISAHDLIRSYASHSHAESESVQLAPGLHVSQSATPRKRRVHNQLDWFEMMLSSILPSMAQRVLQSSTHDEALKLTKTLQEHICYALHAVAFFRQHPNNFTHVLTYLEAHRRECTTSSMNVAQPNVDMRQTMHDNINVSVNTNHRPQTSNSNSHSSSSTHKSPKTSKASNASKYNGDDCGNFNSFNGCPLTKDKCPKKHICRHCKSSEHAKPKCPIFAALRK